MEQKKCGVHVCEKVSYTCAQVGIKRLFHHSAQRASSSGMAGTLKEFDAQSADLDVLHVVCEDVLYDAMGMGLC